MERIQEIQQRWHEDGGEQPITPDQQMDGDYGDDAYDTGNGIWPAEYNIWVCYSNCQICQGNANAGPVKAGEPFPSGDTAPPAHDHCNCDLEPAPPDRLERGIPRRSRPGGRPHP